VIEQTVSYALLQAMKSTRGPISPVLAGLGLHPGQDLLLSALWREDGIAQTELAARLGIEAPTVSRALDRLGRAGYVRREPGRTRTLELGTLVTGVHHRHPGLLAKFATTLDVLSAGRVWLGIGAGWNADESRGLGVPFPPLAERFERLEETLRILHQMFAGDATPFEGKHYQLERPLNVPAPLRRPPILIGGAGEQKTLRLVARYADACNMSDQTDLPHKFDVLRRHCEEAGRPYDAIVKTSFGVLGDDRDLGRVTARFAALADLGVDLAIVDLPHAEDLSLFDFLARLVAELEPLGRLTPAILTSHAESR
jgi:alkanesulfonate monooxygenase SsuD/methylene tetrahydromethanopterin reductase-like flavin-dependent oxidoreductase (luciferase family)